MANSRTSSLLSLQNRRGERIRCETKRVSFCIPRTCDSLFFNSAGSVFKTQIRGESSSLDFAVTYVTKWPFLNFLTICDFNFGCDYKVSVTTNLVWVPLKVDACNQLTDLWITKTLINFKGVNEKGKLKEIEIIFVRRRIQTYRNSTAELVINNFITAFELILTRSCTICIKYLLFSATKRNKSAR